MPGLSAALSNAQRSLGAFSSALDTVQTNIANAATPGYARQRASLAPVIFPDGTGTGVELARVESLRNKLLDLQVLSARQNEGRLSELATFFSSTESIFRINSSGGIDQALDGFFSAAALVSATPGDITTRGTFLRAAEGVAGAFHQARAELADQQAGLDGSVRESVQRINELLTEVAKLEGLRNQRDPRATNSAVDTRSQQALEELSGLIGIDVQRQRDGTLAVVSGSAPLLTGVFTNPLQVSLANDSIRVYDSTGKDVSSTIQNNGGALGGALEARNEIVPALAADLDKLAKRFADGVNEQLAQGVDLTGQAGQPLFSYAQTAVNGSGRTAGLTGTATPTPPQVQVDFTGDFTATITAELKTFVVGSGPPTAAVAGDIVTLRLTSADGSVDRTITTTPLLGGETAADLATRINDQISVDPELAGLVNVSDAGGSLKVTLSELAGQEFSFEASTEGSGFTTGLEAGGTLGSQSAAEIAAALNAEIASEPELVAANIHFAAVNGELRLDGDARFDFAVTDIDADATGFASGLNGIVDTAGGLGAAATIDITDIRAVQIAAAQADVPGGNQNINAILGLADADLIEGATLNEYFAGVVSQFGGAAAGTYAQLETQQHITVA